MRTPGLARPAAGPLVLAIVLAATGGCSGVTPSGSAAPAGPSGRSSIPALPSESADPLTVLATAAAAEGSLNTIGLDPDRCGDRQVLDTFAERYSLDIHELDPGATPAQQLAAVVSSDPSGPSAAPETPDVLELDVASATDAASAGLLAPYRVATWETIPDNLRDADGRWTGGYSGAVAFETNLAGDTAPPSDWSSLLDDSRRDQVALVGDPRLSDDGVAAVYAAALGNGGSLDDARPGLEYFATLAEHGKLLPQVATSASIVRRATPVAIRWTWDALAHKANVSGSPDIVVAVPRTGRLAGVRALAISAFAAHPNAARLWLEFLLSDEGQILWLRHSCVPTRFTDLSEQGAIPPDVEAGAPDIGDVAIPTAEQLTAARSLITSQWDAIVGVDIR